MRVLDQFGALKESSLDRIKVAYENGRRRRSSVRVSEPQTARKRSSGTHSTWGEARINPELSDRTRLVLALLEAPQGLAGLSAFLHQCYGETYLVKWMRLGGGSTHEQRVGLAQRCLERYRGGTHVSVDGNPTEDPFDFNTPSTPLSLSVLGLFCMDGYMQFLESSHCIGMLDQLEEESVGMERRRKSADEENMVGRWRETQTSVQKAMMAALTLNPIGGEGRFLAALLSAIESLPVAVSVCSLAHDTTLIYAVNRHFELIYGHTRRQSVGEGVLFMAEKEGQEELIQSLSRNISQGKASYVQVKCLRRDGSSFVNHLALRPVLDKNKRPVYYVAVHFDHTHPVWTLVGDLCLLSTVLNLLPGQIRI
eukprot:comp15087_c0_seq1/m.11738 comp15087_c0_seq1/g.11738  ORF comp15087_c0_seq1/g.11738 comp15087_c0_seq1/m.11738 type:complete len:367 (-) comp15087_c0_seq1:282-1382(-)